MSSPRSFGDVFRLVLVSPMHAGNVGAVARVAANFDLTDVRVVAPLCRWRAGEARLYAKGPAQGVLESMREHETLAAALAGCGHAVGFTRRTGDSRRANMGVAELSRLGADGVRAALVFGREDGGLTNEELLACTDVCSFAVGKTMPSLNLSHAVAVAVARAYEGFAVGVASSTEDAPAPLEQVGALFAHWHGVATDLGLTTAGNPERMLSCIRRLVQRASPTEREIGVLRAYLSKTQVALGTRRRGKRVSPSKD